MWVLLESCSAKFCALLKSLLSEDHNVGMFLAGRELIADTKDTVMLFCGRLPKSVRLEKGIYLPMGRKTKRRFKGDISVICADNERVGTQNLHCYRCGFSLDASLTISSKTEDRLVIALQHRITSLYGRVIEPFELPVEQKNGIDDAQLLCAYMTKLLLYPIEE